MELILVRHPQPDVASGICYGRSDVPVSPAAVTAVADKLKNAGLPGSVPVYASPLTRCADLAAHMNARVTFDARLAEMDFGAWEMRPWDDIPRLEVDAWGADLLHYRPGGGENVMDVARRVASFFDELREAERARALLICHAGSMRLLAALHAGGSIEEAALRAASAAHRIDYGGIVVLKG